MDGYIVLKPNSYLSSEKHFEQTVLNQDSHINVGTALADLIIILCLTVAMSFIFISVLLWQCKRERCCCFLNYQSKKYLTDSDRERTGFGLRLTKLYMVSVVTAMMLFCQALLCLQAVTFYDYQKFINGNSTQNLNDKERLKIQ